MPKRGAFALGLTAFALALLLNFQTPSDVAVVTGRQGVPAPGSRTGTSGAGGTSGGTSGTSGGATGGTSGSATDATGTRTVTGSTVDTRYGPVQVSVSLRDRTIVDITALQLPSGGRSGQISRFVEPILRSQALQAQGSNIDGVSGATFTSAAYAQSLQAALDSAGA